MFTDATQIQNVANIIKIYEFLFKPKIELSQSIPAIT